MNREGNAKLMERLNDQTIERLHRLRNDAARLNIGVHHDGRLLDFGVDVRGGLGAGIELANICMGGLGDVRLVPGRSDVVATAVQVWTDQPLLACMGCQYGGWQVKAEQFFAIGSGPLRLKRGREAVLERYALSSVSQQVVGVLECEGLPDEGVIASMAAECGVAESSLYLCVAPVGSMAGMLQVVARSVEAVMHKLHELGADLNAVTSAIGRAPLPDPVADQLLAIGRSNDAILYEGTVTLWTEWSDEEIAELGPKVPSSSSPDFGKPFVELFRACGGDFYKLDPMLFSAAIVEIASKQTGNRQRFGRLVNS